MASFETARLLALLLLSLGHDDVKTCVWIKEMNGRKGKLEKQKVRPKSPELGEQFHCI